MADYISSHSGSQIDGAVDTVLNIQQTTGENTNYLMSQKAITDAITASQPEIVQTTGTSETAIMSQKAVTNMYDGKINVGGSLSLVGEDIQNTNNASWSSGVGSDIVISKNFGCSFGAFSQCNAEMGVSMGAYAVCDEELTVSVGEPTRTRRIVNVTDPINSQDVATKNYVDGKMVVLYSNDSGTQEDITLNDDVSNYTYVDVFFKASNAYFATQRIFNPNGNGLTLSTNSAYGPTKSVMTFVSVILFSGNSVTWNKDNDVFYSVNSDNQATFDFSRSLSIYQIIGYK